MSKTKSKDLRAFALLLDNDGKLLVIKRGPKTKNAGKIGLPGGHCDPGEDQLLAVLRETKEELGVQLEVSAPHFRFSIGIRTYFVFELPSPVTEIVNPDEVSAVRMVRLDWLEHQSKDTLHTSLKDILPWATARFNDLLLFVERFKKC
jgi:8-oxo-dGTP pyrophosphatase MutT (NUDIX family)